MNSIKNVDKAFEKELGSAKSAVGVVPRVDCHVSVETQILFKIHEELVRIRTFLESEKQ